MGSILSTIWGKLFKSEKNYNILIVGLANAGKTTLLYRMYKYFEKGPWGRPSRQHRQLEAMYNK